MSELEKRVFKTNYATVTATPSPIKLPPELKEKWLRALRTANYTQGRGNLCIGAFPRHYCCLGVLSEVQGRLIYRFGIGRDKHEGANLGLSQDNEAAFVQLYKFKVTLGEPDLSVEGGKYHADIAELNDRGVSFAQIADIIEYTF